MYFFHEASRVVGVWRKRWRNLRVLKGVDGGVVGIRGVDSLLAIRAFRAVVAARRSPFPSRRGMRSRRGLGLEVGGEPWLLN